MAAVIIPEEESKILPEKTESNIIKQFYNKVIDSPLFSKKDTKIVDSGLTAVPMSEEQKHKLRLSLSITRYSFITIGAMLLIASIFAFSDKPFDNSLITNVLDMMKTILILALGFMFGNQNKRD